MITSINRALEASRLKREENEKGFTLIELLVVVIIIGILAAIAIPVFLNQRNSAWEAAARSDLRNAQLAAETWATTHNGKYTGLTTANVTSQMKLSDGVAVTVGTVTDTTYVLSVDNANLPDTADNFTVFESGSMLGPTAAVSTRP